MSPLDSKQAYLHEPPRPYRLTGRDNCGNRYFVVVEPARIYVVNARHESQHMSTISRGDAARLVFELEDIRDGGGTRAQKEVAMCFALKSYSGYEWAPLDRKEP